MVVHQKPTPTEYRGGCEGGGMDDDPMLAVLERLAFGKKGLAVG
jgi:hypothetical protein